MTEAPEQHADSRDGGAEVKRRAARGYDITARRRVPSIEDGASSYRVRVDARVEFRTTSSVVLNVSLRSAPNTTSFLPVA